MTKFKLIIFDVGGVLRNSSEAINEGIKKGFLEQGFEYPFSAQDTWHLRGVGKYNNSRNCIKALLASLKSKKELQPLLNSDNAETALDSLVAENIGKEDEEGIDRIRKKYKEFFYSAKAKSLIGLVPNAKKAMDLLLEKGYLLAIFTNAKVSSVERDLKELDLKRFSAIVSEEDIEQKKPSGEGLKQVMDKLSTSPKETAYVGDAVVDIKAARDAGCSSAAVTCGMGLAAHLKKEKPDFLFKDVWEMSNKL